MKLKYTILLIWLLEPIASCVGQNLQLIDSIRNELGYAHGLKKFKLLNDLAWEHRFASPDSTIYYAKLAYQEGRMLNLTSGLARSVNILGLAHNYKGERLLAFDHYSKALQLATANKDSVQIAHTHNNMGRMFFEQGLLGRSYEHFIKSKLIFQKIRDENGVAYTLQSLGNLYKVQRDNKKSEESFTAAYKIRLKLRTSREIMSALLYLAKFYQEAGEWEKSIKCLKMADSTGQVINDKINLAEIKTYLAESYLNVGNLREAGEMGKAGVAVIEQMNNVRMRPQAYHIMGQIHLLKGDLSSARMYFTASLKIAERIRDLNGKMKAYYDLWKLSEKEKNERERLLNFNQYLILKDSIKDLDVARQLERFQFELEIERKEQENRLLKADDIIQQAVIRQQRLQNVILIGIVSFVSALGFVLWINNRKRRDINDQLLQQNIEIQKQREEIIRQNQKLSKRNQQLSDLNHEKNTLMSIVAHDLKSPLNRIQSINELMEMEGGLSDDQKFYMKLTSDATHAGLDLITDLLDVHMLEENAEPSYSSVDLSKFLRLKVEQFTPAAAAKSINLYITRVSSEQIRTEIEYLTRIMDNLLSNAIKFSERGSTVVVAGGSVVDEFWISVKDHGPGFTSWDKQYLYQKFKKLSARPTAGESSNGLGLAIVKTLVDRLKGKIELSSEDGKGSEFIVRIPNAKESLQDSTPQDNSQTLGKLKS